MNYNSKHHIIQDISSLTRVHSVISSKPQRSEKVSKDFLRSQNHNCSTFTEIFYLCCMHFISIRYQERLLQDSECEARCNNKAN